jgi:hypothetical protein
MMEHSEPIEGDPDAELRVGRDENGEVVFGYHKKGAEPVELSTQELLSLVKVHIADGQLDPLKVLEVLKKHAN